MRTIAQCLKYPGATQGQTAVMRNHPKKTIAAHHRQEAFFPLLYGNKGKGKGAHKGPPSQNIRNRNPCRNTTKETKMVRIGRLECLGNARLGLLWG